MFMYMIRYSSSYLLLVLLLLALVFFSLGSCGCFHGGKGGQDVYRSCIRCILIILRSKKDDGGRSSPCFSL